MQGQECSKASICPNLCVCVCFVYISFCSPLILSLCRPRTCSETTSVSLFFSLTTKWLGLFLYHKQKPGEYDHPSRGFGLHTVLSLFGEAASLWSNSLYLTFCLARFPDVTKPKTSGAWHSVLPALPCCHD